MEFDNNISSSHSSSFNNHTQVGDNKSCSDHHDDHDGSNSGIGCGCGGGLVEPSSSSSTTSSSFIPHSDHLIDDHQKEINYNINNTISDSNNYSTYTINSNCSTTSISSSQRHIHSRNIHRHFNNNHLKSRITTTTTTCPINTTNNSSIISSSTTTITNNNLLIIGGKNHNNNNNNNYNHYKRTSKKLNNSNTNNNHHTTNNNNNNQSTQSTPSHPIKLKNPFLICLFHRTDSNRSIQNLNLSNRTKSIRRSSTWRLKYSHHHHHHHQHRPHLRKCDTKTKNHFNKQQVQKKKRKLQQYQQRQQENNKKNNNNNKNKHKMVVSNNLNMSMTPIKSGYMYRLGGGVFRMRKKYWFVLTKTHLIFYSSPEKVTSSIESINISDVRNITLNFKDAQQQQNSQQQQASPSQPPIDNCSGFTIEVQNTNKIVIQVSPLSILADWVIKLNGLIHCNFASHLSEFEHKKLMAILFKNNIKGGIIKSAPDDDESTYLPNGTVTIQQLNQQLSTSTSSSASSSSSSSPNTSYKTLPIPNSPIEYYWDGEWFIPTNPSIKSSVGYGRFNGIYLAWYIDDSASNNSFNSNNLLTSSTLTSSTSSASSSSSSSTKIKYNSQASSSPILVYYWDEGEREYQLMDNRKEYTFKWTRHFLASKYRPDTYSTVEGMIPEPVVMFLQLVKYSVTKDHPSSPFNQLLSKIQSNLTNSVNHQKKPTTPSEVTTTTEVTLKTTVDHHEQPIHTPVHKLPVNESTETTRDENNTTNTTATTTIALSSSPPVISEELPCEESSSSFISNNDNQSEPAITASSASITTTTNATNNQPEKPKLSKSIDIPPFKKLPSSSTQSNNNSAVLLTPYARGQALINVTNHLFTSDFTNDDDSKIVLMAHSPPSSPSSSPITTTDSSSLSIQFKSHSSAASTPTLSNPLLLAIEKNNQPSEPVQQQESPSSNDEETKESFDSLSKMFNKMSTKNTDGNKKNTIKLLNQTISESQKIQNRISITYQTFNNDDGSAKQHDVDDGKLAPIPDQPEDSASSVVSANTSTSNDVLDKFVIDDYFNESPISSNSTTTSTTTTNNSNVKNDNTQSITVITRSTRSASNSSTSSPTALTSIAAKFLNNINNNNNNNTYSYPQTSSAGVPTNRGLNNLKLNGSPSSSHSNSPSPQVALHISTSPIPSVTEPLGSVIGPTGGDQDKKTSRKPLSKTRSSDKVVSIIDKIVSTKQTRQSFCLACTLPINGPMMIAFGNSFHKDCWKCSKCSKELGTKTFYRQLAQSNSNNDLNYNHPLDNNNSKGTTPKPSNSPTCSPRLSRRTSISASITSSSPSSITTSPILQGVNNNNNNGGSGGALKYLCESCHHDSVKTTICPTCNESVMYRCVSALGKKYHVDHFICNSCSVPLLGKPFAEIDGKPYCELHSNTNNSNNNNNNNYNQNETNIDNVGSSCSSPMINDSNSSQISNVGSALPIFH